MMDGNMIDGGGVHYVGPQSPVDMKPDATHLLTTVSSPNNVIPTTSYMTFGTTNSNQQTPQTQTNYPPSHPLSGAKHMCSICGDRASGKHYGVYSCEGCKGFFKRTVRKELSYACREEKNCIVDKRQRNRCQYCRYMKCLSMGMKREAVQEERGVGKGSKDGGEGGDDLEASLYNPNEMPHQRILEAENACDKFQENLNPQDIGDDMAAKFKFAHETQQQALVEWAKLIPHFTELSIEDQVALLRNGWNELMIAGFSHRSIGLNEGIMLSHGIVATRETAHEAGVGQVLDRVLVELVGKMTEMKMSKTELGFLRAIVLYNADAKGLTESNKVEQLRERVYASLEDYVRMVQPSETGRFAKLLLRLPALRSIGLKCDEHLFFFKMISDNQSDFEANSSGFEFHLRELLESIN